MSEVHCYTSGRVNWLLELIKLAGVIKLAEPPELIKLPELLSTTLDGHKSSN